MDTFGGRSKRQTGSLAGRRRTGCTLYSKADAAASWAASVMGRPFNTAALKVAITVCPAPSDELCLTVAIRAQSSRQPFRVAKTVLDPCPDHSIDPPGPKRGCSTVTCHLVPTDREAAITQTCFAAALDCTRCIWGGAVVRRTLDRCTLPFASLWFWWYTVVT